MNFITLVDEEITYYQVKFVKDEHTNDHIIAGFHNVDEETKRKLDALDQTEAANKARRSFLFNMSHDRKTPMNVIIGFTNMLKASDSKRLNNCLGKVELSSQHLLPLINDVLDMVRIKSSKIDNRAGTHQYRGNEGKLQINYQRSAS